MSQSHLKRLLTNSSSSHDREDCMRSSSLLRISIKGKYNIKYSCWKLTDRNQVTWHSRSQFPREKGSTLSEWPLFLQVFPSCIFQFTAQCIEAELKEAAQSFDIPTDLQKQALEPKASESIKTWGTKIPEKRDLAARYLHSFCCWDICQVLDCEELRGSETNFLAWLQQFILTSAHHKHLGSRTRTKDVAFKFNIFTIRLKMKSHYNKL